MTQIKTASGRTRRVPAHVDTTTILGLDGAGRVVVQEDWMKSGDAYAFGLTLCCDAWDKGMEDGIYCRACYGAKPDADAGHYMWADGNGDIPGLDPVVELTVPH